MILAWLLLLVEAAAAFFTLDIFFRFISLDPALLRQRLLRYALIYSAIAALLCGTGAVGQWLAAGYAGLAAAAFNWLPWWLLWRFGLRKQFTFLFKSDGGHPLGTKKPDP